MDACVLHEKLMDDGGAQRVAYEIARALDAPIYAGWVDQDVVPDDVEAVQVFSERSRRWMWRGPNTKDALMMYGWTNCGEPAGHDLVVVNKNSASWYVPQPEQAVLMYGHHTLRSIDDRWHVRERGPLGPFKAVAQRTLFGPNFRRADRLLVNSEVVGRRFELYYDLEPDAVVHPPVDVASLGSDLAGDGGYHLSLGRLAPNKRVVDVVEACESAGVSLKVAGDGSCRGAVEEAAGEHTEVLGRVTEDEKRTLLSGARSLIMNAEREDFGVVPIEALASGTPVIGVDEGFTAHQVDDGVNGLLYERGCLRGALESFEEAREDFASDSELERGAERYNHGRFRREIVHHAEGALSEVSR